VPEPPLPTFLPSAHLLKIVPELNHEPRFTEIWSELS
jgi:hypothetical protein